MKANTDVKAGDIFGYVVVITNIAANHNFTGQVGLVNLNETQQVAVA